jgi:hypothetical protein
MDKRKRLEWLATVSMTDEDCPSVEQLADYALGLLSGMEQLQVRAHVQRCPVCAEDVMAARPPVLKRREQVAIGPLPIPLLERRSSGTDSTVRQYLAADLEVNLTIGRLEGETRRLSGQVLRDHSPLPDATVTLRVGRRQLKRLSNEAGFFSFEGVPRGQHNLSITDGQVALTINELLVTTDDN